MSDKSTLQDIDYTNEPDDWEEVGVDDNGRTTWYRDIVKGVGYKYITLGYCWSKGDGCNPCCNTRIKRPSNTFTKCMLVAGKHIVETRGSDGLLYCISALDDGRRFLDGDSFHIFIESFNEDLTLGYEVASTFDIIRVFTRLSTLSNKLIWERTPPKVLSQKELQLAALQDTINKAQEQIEELMKD
jgi:hypothetical protein